MKETEFQGDQLFGDDVPTFAHIGPAPAEVPSGFHTLPDTDPAELSAFALQRAQRLENVLARLRGLRVVAATTPEGCVPSINWTSDDGLKERRRVVPTHDFYRGMSLIAVDLFRDLRGQGEEVLAVELVDQHRRHERLLADRYGGKGETTRTP